MPFEMLVNRKKTNIRFLKRSANKYKQKQSVQKKKRKSPPPEEKETSSNTPYLLSVVTLSFGINV